MSDERTSPNSIEAERSVLGAILLHEDTLGEAAAVLQPVDFFRDAHRRIFKAMLELQSRRVSIDPTTLLVELDRVGDLEDTDGPGYIAALVDGVPRSTNVEAYARIIVEKASLRKLIKAGNQMVADAYEGKDDAVTILERAEQKILGLAEGTVQTGFESLRSVATRAMDIIERLQTKRGGGLSGVPSGFTDLDNVTRGFQPGTLNVIGARPGIGKTSLATNIAQNAASRDHVVGMFSLEMPKEELFFRQLASTARIDSHRLQGGWLGEREWGHVSQALDELAELPMHLDETPALSMFTVRSRARRLKAEAGLALLVIDYLQLMGTSGRHETRAGAISEITASLKSLAKELRIPIIVLSQLNRESVKGDKPRRPQLYDLKESGSIEQDADIVMLLHREPDADHTEVIFAKHRNGSEGVVKLGWNPTYTRFDNYAQEPEERQLPMGTR